MTNKVEIIVFNPTVKDYLPATGHKEDAGIDCYALEDVTIPSIIKAGKKQSSKDAGGPSTPVSVPIKLGFGVKMPKRTILDKITGKRWHAEVTGRSSQNKNGVLVMRGIIDETYEGEIIACLVNFNPFDVVYKKGERICQLLFDKCRKPTSADIRILTKEARKDGGFGSTGK
jgi:dUTPase